MTAPVAPEAGSMLDSWRRAVRSTERCDRTRAETAVRAAYRTAGLEQPETVVWMESPLGGLLACTALLLRSADARRLVHDQVSALRDRAVTDLASRIVRHDPRIHELMGDYFLPPPIIRAALEPDVPDALTRLAWLHGTLFGYVWGTSLPRLAPRVPGEAREAVCAALDEQLADHFRDTDRDLLHGVLGGDVLGGGDREIDGRLIPQNAACLGPHNDAYIMAAATLALDVLGWEPPPQLAATSAAVQTVGSWWPAPGAVVLCERPTAMRLDELGRPHSPRGPAVRYADGWVAYALEGYPVPADMVTGPGWSSERIRAEPSPALRRLAQQWLSPLS